MSLNCCHGLQRKDSDYDMNKRFIDDTNTGSMPSKLRNKKCITERTWSGNLIPSPKNHKYKSRGDAASPRNLKAHHRRHGSMGPVPRRGEDEEDLMEEPKLVRSGGIRRDWSFENLEAQLREGKRSKQRR